MRHLILIPLVASLVAAIAPTSAEAHQLTVVEPGSARLDLGTVSSARLVHATLEQPTDTLALDLHPGNRPLELLLLVPDAPPERRAAGKELPTANLEELEPVDGATLADEVTGATYRVVGEALLGGGAGDAASPRAIEFVRGSEPTRLAVLVRDPEAPFAAEDVQRTPRTLIALRSWQETPAAGADVKPAPAPRGSAGAAGYAATLALVAAMTAVWWIRAGRNRARARGVERELDGS